MKRIFAGLAVLAALVAVIAALPKGRANSEFLRIHIRADSNSEADQNVKYAVKTAIVDYLTPFLAQVHSKEEAMSTVRSALNGIEQTANTVLQANGFEYKAHAKLCREQFPDRTYGELTLEQGVYDALIIELGSGSGNNWWCVVYPPLCFVNGQSNGTDQIVYRSRIAEIIREWKASHGG